ncbi:hypothetical protein MMC26_005650 [Xylographa opegraphella]|nr:hypothetical protein [Xylographa opegraphella]
MPALFRSLTKLHCSARPPVSPRALWRRSASTKQPTELDLASRHPIQIKLREYQEECIQAVLAHLARGHKRLGVSLATGSGKTVIFTQLVDRVKAPAREATQTLILAHRRELVEQAARHCALAYPTKSIEIEMGRTHASGAADITVASVRSIASGDRMSKFYPERFKLVLVDEAHHIVASSYMETLKHFGLLEPSATSPALVGVSATLSRFDGLRLGAAIDHIVYHKDYVDMIGERWLSDVIFTTVQSKADISKVSKSNSGDFMQSELSSAVNTNETNDIAVRAWLSRAHGRKSTIVFCVDLAHVSGLTMTFRKHGIDARFVTGNTHNKTRAELLDAFKSGEFPVLLNCGVFTEGTDIPNIDCVLLARPTRSRNLLVQMIGRGMRLHPGKENCHIIDMVASLETGVVTIPTLFGLDPSELVKEAGVEQLKELKQKNDLEVADVRPPTSTGTDTGRVPSSTITFTDYDSVYDLIDDTSGERHIRGISQLAWVHVAEDRYVLSSQDGEYLTIEKTGVAQPAYQIRYNARVSSGLVLEKEWRPYSRTREVARADTFSDAVHAADTFAAETFPRYIIGRGQAWRKVAATSGQLAFLNKLKEVDGKLRPEQLTKGKAADMITKVKFGARGRLAKLQAQQRRTQKEQSASARLARLRAREEVHVGPLTV